VATQAAGRKLPFIVTVRDAVVRRQGVANRQKRVPRITPVSEIDAGFICRHPLRRDPGRLPELGATVARDARPGRRKNYNEAHVDQRNSA
jgi:hypothetical protein